MQQKCPKCSSSLNVDERHLGKTVRCPKCSEVFVVPPPLDRIVPPPVDTRLQQSSTLHPTQIAQRAGSVRRQKRRVSTILAFCMLGATILYPIGIVGMAIVGSVSAAKQAQVERTNSVDLPFGDSIVFGPNGVVGKSASRKEAEQAGTFLGILIGSICCPGIPYVLVMLGLGVGYFAFRSAGN